MTNREQILHLYNRAGFGLGPLAARQLPDSVDATVRKLFETHLKIVDMPDEPSLKHYSRSEMKNMSKSMRKKNRQAMRKMTLNLVGDFISQMAQTESPLTYKMMLFWHGHFACRIKNPLDGREYLDVLRRHGLGSFRDLLLGISQSGAMIKYLNNQQNRKQSPNENFAREVMELFTLGEGNDYTEQDIKEAARAFTGWTSSGGEFKVVKFWHDPTRKTIFGKTGKFGGEDVINMLLEKEETAQHIVRKTYAYFVNPNVNEKRVLKLAKAFYKSGYDIQKLMESIFSADWFYDTEQIGSRIKSPIELITHLSLIFDLTFDGYLPLLFAQRQLGQVIFNPPNVAGWPGGRAWIDNSTLLLRLNLPGIIFREVDMQFTTKNIPEELNAKGKSKLKAEADVKPLVEAFESSDYSLMYDQLVEYMIRVPLKYDKQKLIAATIQTNPSDYIKSLAIRLASLPEFQVC